MSLIHIRKGMIKDLMDRTLQIKDLLKGMIYDKEIEVIMEMCILIIKETTGIVGSALVRVFLRMIESKKK